MTFGLIRCQTLNTASGLRSVGNSFLKDEREHKFWQHITHMIILNTKTKIIKIIQIGSLVVEQPKGLNIPCNQNIFLSEYIAEDERKRQKND